MKKKKINTLSNYSYSRVSWNYIKKDRTSKHKIIYNYVNIRNGYHETTTVRLSATFLVHSGQLYIIQHIVFSRAFNPPAPSYHRLAATTVPHNRHDIPTCCRAILTRPGVCTYQSSLHSGETYMNLFFIFESRVCVCDYYAQSTTDRRHVVPSVQRYRYLCVRVHMYTCTYAAEWSVYEQAM